MKGGGVTLISTTMDISVVICTYNRGEILRSALESVVQQETDGKFSYEVVVVDNASTDSTKAVVQQVATSSPVPVRYILEDDKGVAATRNRGVKESRGAWIAFFDDDQYAESYWLKNLVDVALHVGGYCVAGTRDLVLPEGQLKRLGPVCRNILGEYIWNEEPVIYRGSNLPSTGNILIARSIFESIGLFDTSLLGGGEDYDLVLRARIAGFDIWSAPNAVVHHLIPPYRLEPAYFRWVCLREGGNLAQINCKQMGCGKTLLLCIARIGQALLVNIPLLFLAYLKYDKSEILDRKSLLWRAVGYARRSLHLLAPRAFPQQRFFARLEFRSERTSIAYCEEVRRQFRSGA